MALSFTLMPSIVFYRSRRPIFAHALFALHLYAFLLLLFCIALTVVGANLIFGGVGLESPSLDHALSILLALASAVYLYMAAGTVYGARGALRILQVALLAIAAACIVLGYRFSLLLITLHTT